MASPLPLRWSSDSPTPTDASNPIRCPEAPPLKPLARQIPPSRLTELSGTTACARLTAAVALVIRAQRDGALVAWVEPERGGLYPPDLAESGVDLDSLVVVHVSALRLPKATEMLLRSGAFGLVVLDLTAGTPRSPELWQQRLGGLLRHHETRLVLLTRTPASSPSLGPWVALRVEPQLERRGPGRFVLKHRVLKDKTGMLTPVATEARRGPAGLG